MAARACIRSRSSAIGWQDEGKRCLAWLTPDGQITAVGLHDSMGDAQSKT